MNPYYEHAGITIYDGDCAEILPALGIFDALVTYPPYGVELTKRVTKHTTRIASTTYQDEKVYIIRDIVPRFKEALKHAKRAAVTPGTRSLFLYPEPTEMGCVFFPNGAGRSSWGFGTYNPILFYGRCPYLEAGRGSMPNGVMATHWLSDDVDHPCPKPLAWMKWMVKRATLTGPVLDCFMGSGTTLEACKVLGFSATGIEIEECYCEIAANRLSQEVLALSETVSYEQLSL